MNKVILIGRLTRDPDVRWTQGQDQKATARFTLAVDRRGKQEENRQSADFISCVAFGRQAEFAEKYLRQGIKIALVGRIATGSYTNRDGQKVYTTDVIADEMEFTESKAAAGGNQNSRSGQQEAPAPYPTDDNGFMNIPDGIDEELPFS